MSGQVSEHDSQDERGQHERKRDRQKRRRQEQLAEQQQQRRQARRRRGALMVLAAVVAVAAVFGLAMLIAGGDASDGDDGPSTGQGGDSAASDVAAASVDGSGLAPIPADGGDDPAVGADAPDVTGESFAGEPVTLGTDQDSAQAILLLAHWCPHCQAEVPEVVQWVDDGVLPSDVELVAVSTLHRPDQGNWPPDQWLADEGWPGQVLADPDNSVAQAYGLAATPSWVFVDGDGEVAERVSGRVGREQLESTLSAISD